MIFGKKEKSIILIHTIYCWLSPQFYICVWWLMFAVNNYLSPQMKLSVHEHDSSMREV